MVWNVGSYFKGGTKLQIFENKLLTEKYGDLRKMKEVNVIGYSITKNFTICADHLILLGSWNLEDLDGVGM